ncbi:helix-turn-helix domain-containing protein [Paenibacillus residui]|uniref:Helix-turn-helix domain-containing protein n=1 Tax=Paenibacillus residui TaxID=629724 RepID=A0ABW3D5S9_9BACL
MKFGAIMQACRERAGLTQEQMAELLHRSQSCISKYEKDHKAPDVQTLIQWINITNAKEVFVAFLCGIDGVSIMQNILQIFGGG